MSHFLTFVLLEARSCDLEMAVASLLAPYDMNMEVAPYCTVCPCVEWETHTDAEQSRYIFSIEDGEEVSKEPPRLLHEPHPLCSECGGSGVVESTDNPSGKWDWWQIGGRWTGFFEALFREEASRALNNHDLGNNSWENIDVLPAMEVPEGAIPYAMVTPEGAWYERTVDGSAEEWNNTVRNLLVENLSCMVVICDLHN